MAARTRAELSYSSASQRGSTTRSNGAASGFSTNAARPSATAHRTAGLDASNASSPAA
jgi:hypothetical protein